MKPIIGILSTNCEGTQEDYMRAIESAGGCPVILSRVDDLKSIEPIIRIIDGIIFTGGTDVNPLIYGEMPQKELGVVNPEKDEFELSLAKWILANADIPILGICRGMQILNLAAGGSLYQDLLGQNATKFNHWLKDIFPKNEPSHIVSITDSSKLYHIFKMEKIAVNSFHHQGIKTIGKNFEATMIAEDSVIEAIEMKGKRFVVGVQWHPEKLIQKYPKYLALFKTFIEYCLDS